MDSKNDRMDKMAFHLFPVQNQLLSEFRKNFLVLSPSINQTANGELAKTEVNKSQNVLDHLSN